MVPFGCMGMSICMELCICDAVQLNLRKINNHASTFRASIKFDATGKDFFSIEPKNILLLFGSKAQCIKLYKKIQYFTPIKIRIGSPPTMIQFNTI